MSSAASLALYDPDGGMNNVESLYGREIASFIPNINAGVEEFSPARRVMLPQQVLEPILLERGRELGARFMYSHEVIDVEQDDDGVSLIARHVDDGTERPRARPLPRRLRRQPQPDPRAARASRCPGTGCCRAASRSTSEPTAATRSAAATSA